MCCYTYRVFFRFVSKRIKFLVVARYHCFLDPALHTINLVFITHSGFVSIVEAAPADMAELMCNSHSLSCPIIYNQHMRILTQTTQTYLIHRPNDSCNNHML